MNNIPSAYTIGWVPFIHVDIYLDSRPLIPRTETEYWVDIAIKEIKMSGIEKPKILDLCAGSGCIGVAVLKEIPGAKVDFAEIDASHHKTIERNLLENGLVDRGTKIFDGDLFENVPGSYDFILCNPPYINPELKDRVGESVVMNEPEIALYGGKGGLEIIKRVLSDAPRHLNKGGIIYIEHEPEQVEELSHEPLFLSAEKDQYGVMRFSKFKGNYKD